MHRQISLIYRNCFNYHYSNNDFELCPDCLYGFNRYIEGLGE